MGVKFQEARQRARLLSAASVTVITALLIAAPLGLLWGKGYLTPPLENDTLRAEKLAGDAIALAASRWDEMAVLQAENARLRGSMVLPVAETTRVAKVDAFETALELCYDSGGEKRCVAPELQYRRPTKLYWVPPDSKMAGWRFQHLVRQGLEAHPFVELVKTAEEADLVLFLSISTKIFPTVPAEKLLVLDESDSPGFDKRVGEANYLMYLKRSWVLKKDGAYTGTGRRYVYNYYPMAYSISDSYISTGPQPERTLAVVCSNRLNPKQPTRERIVSWVRRFLEDRPTLKGIAGEVNKAGRREINEAYFDTLRSAKILVTCNPSHWEGDFRTFEAMASGALVFVDKMYTPHPMAFVDGLHVIVYDNSDEDALVKKLDYYLAHPQEAEVIAARGFAHALRYHRAVSRIDYVLRSADEISGRKGAKTLYRQTAMQIHRDVNATTQISPIVDIAAPEMNKPTLDPKHNLGRKVPPSKWRKHDNRRRRHR